MAEIRTETTQTTQSSAVRTSNFYRTRNIVYTILGVIEILLAFRFLFLILGANSANAFASFIYGLTDILVAPFEGIFGAASRGVSTFDPSTLVAAAVYAIIAWVIVRIVAAAKNRPTDRV